MSISMELAFSPPPLIVLLTGPFGVWGVTGNVEVEEVERKWKGEKGEEEWEEKKMVGSCWKTLKRWECI